MPLSKSLLQLVEQRILTLIDALATDNQEKEQMIRIWKGEPIVKSKCMHVLTSGSRSGQTCDKKVSNKTLTGHYCNAHRSDEICNFISKHGINAGKRCCGLVSNKSKKYCENHLEKHILDPPKNTALAALCKAKIILFKTISGHLVDPNTQLVFDSQKLVIGKEIKGIMCPLTAEDFDFCKRQKIDVAINSQNIGSS